MMGRVATVVSIAAAFAAGCALTHYLQEAIAAEPMTAQIIHTGDMVGDALGAANKVDYRSKTFAAADGATISIQVGNVPKHLHPNANEIQFVLDGTGTIWLGDKEEAVKPGDLVIIPHGTPHGGTKPNGRAIRSITIKTPPQTPDDVKLLD
jgi:mannose-6-phosphate isomerase-like protein (cupin superfamily)